MTFFDFQSTLFSNQKFHSGSSNILYQWKMKLSIFSMTRKTRKQFENNVTSQKSFDDYWLLLFIFATKWVRFENRKLTPKPFYRVNSVINHVVYCELITLCASLRSVRKRVLKYIKIIERIYSKRVVWKMIQLQIFTLFLSLEKNYYLNTYFCNNNTIHNKNKWVIPTFFKWIVSHSKCFVYEQDVTVELIDLKYYVYYNLFLLISCIITVTRRFVNRLI